MQATEDEVNVKENLVENMRPVGMTVLVFRLPHAVESSLGIAIPDSYNEKNYYARLLKKGKGETFPNGNHKPSTIAEPGDIVVVRAFEGKKAITYAKDLLLVHGDRIEAVARKDPWSINLNEKPAPAEKKSP
jgi:co-chaperonin GroES (HSP10)